MKTKMLILPRLFYKDCSLFHISLNKLIVWCNRSTRGLCKWFCFGINMEEIYFFRWMRIKMNPSWLTLMSLKTGIKCILRYWASITYLSKIDIQELFDPMAFLTLILLIGIIKNCKVIFWRSMLIFNQYLIDGQRFFLKKG